MSHKHIITCLAAALTAIAASAQLSFNTDGHFKIVQFTDLHYIYGNPMSGVAVECVEDVLDSEHPDLVVFTGDLIYGAPAHEGIEAVLSPVAKRGIPFCVTLGNHDDEQDMERRAIYDYIRSFKGCVQPDGADYVLHVKSNRSDSTAAAIYCIDSHAYSTVDGVKGYAWHTLDQLNWYAAQSRALTQANGGTPLPALSFFHIPLPEFASAASAPGNPLIGTRREGVGCPQLNSGLFALMRQCGDVMAVIVGHEHDNDYATLWHGILLAYGRYSGGNTVYNHLSNGARVIELSQGSRTFTTWLRLRGGAVNDRTVFPDSYVRDNWKERTAPLAPSPQ